MKEFKINLKSKAITLALGAESAGNFSVFQNGTLHFSKDFGDLLDDANYQRFQTELNKFLKNKKIKLNIILSDLHPLFHTTALAKKIAKKYDAEHIHVQHHLAHIFSSVGDRMIQDTRYKIQDTILGIACDGTGYGLDDKIWGGEIFNIQYTKYNIQNTRIGHLENQILLGAELAIKEPARIIISILSKFLPKKEAYFHVKKYYSENEFEVLWNQLGQNFNCLETSSTARILDAASVLLGFSKNERLSKHGPIEMLEKNSTKPYIIKPIVEFNEQEKMWILKSTPLFEFLIRNFNKDKKRLAATAQAYIANGLIEIVSQCHPEQSEGSRNSSAKTQNDNVFFTGGMANNKIISSLLESQGNYTNKKIPRGDAGISFGQIFYYLLTNPRD